MYTLFITSSSIIELALTVLIFCISFYGYQDDYPFYINFSFILIILLNDTFPLKWNYLIQYHNIKNPSTYYNKYPPSRFDFISVLGIYIINQFINFSNTNNIFYFTIVLCFVKICSSIAYIFFKFEKIFSITSHDKQIQPWYVLKSTHQMGIITYFRDATFSFLIISSIMLSLTTPTNHAFLKEEYSKNVIYFELAIYFIACVFNRLFYYFFDVALYQLVLVAMAMFSGFFTMIGESVERTGSVFAVIMLLQVLTLGFVNNGIPGYLYLKYNNYLVVMLFFGVPYLVFGCVYYCISSMEWEIPLIVFYARYVIAEVLVSIAFVVEFESIFEALRKGKGNMKEGGKVVTEVSTKK